MKKIISMALLAAMVLSCFAGCAMQKGEIDADENIAVINAGYTVPTVGSGADNVKYALRTSLDSDASKVATDSTAKADITWYTGTSNEYTLTTVAQLKGFFELRNSGDSGTTFEGVTIKLGKDMKVDSKTTTIASTKVFKGTFDGQGHVISGMRVESAGSAIRGFFGAAAGDACVKNLSLVNCSLYVNSVGTKYTKSSDTVAANGNKNTAGSIFSQVATDGSNVTIDNVYSDTDIYFISATPVYTVDSNDSSKYVATSATVKNVQYVAGFVGQVTKGTCTITNCVYAGDLATNAGRVGGFVGSVSGSANLVVDNCKNEGTMTRVDKSYVGGQDSVHLKNPLDTANSTLSISDAGSPHDGHTYHASATKVDVSFATDWGGVLGCSTSTGTIEISDVTSSVDIELAKERVAGIVAYVQNAKKLTIIDCVFSGDLQGDGGYVGGIVGRAQNVVTLKIENCTTTAEATLNTGVNSAGIIGYIDGDSTGDVDILNCSFAGVLNADRASGGIAGYPHGKNSDFTMTGCTVSGTLNLNASDSYNNSLGGLIGRFDAKTAVISDCTFNGVLNANFDPKFEEDKSNHCTAGGLIGYIFNANNTAGALELVLSNNEVSGTLNFTDENRDNVATVVPERADRAIYVAYVANSAKVTYSEISTGAGFAINAGKELANMNGASATIVGYQVKENGDTYNLRYVATVDAPVDGTGLGFVVSVYKKEGGAKVAVQENVVTYAKVIYKTINGGNKTYAAADFYADYLYTLEIQGIPAGYSVENGNLEIVITPFTAAKVETEGNVELVYTNSYNAQHGAILIK